MKKSHRYGPGNSAQPSVLASRGTEALRQERFKEAIELFKQAIRQEPRPEWKAALADAWRGRARDLAAKGMFKEAAMVLENTIALGKPVRDPNLYLTCLLRDGQQLKAATYLLSHPEAPETEHDKFGSVAAALLLAVPRLPDPAPGTTPERARWGELAVAARAALTAWCDNAPAEGVKRHLDAISLRSAFRPLRLLLKSLITAPADADRTRQVLDTIPPGSPFYPLRQAVTVAMRRESALEVDDWNRLTPAQQTFVAETSRLAAPASQFLARLAGAERGGPGALFNFLMKESDLPQADVRNACVNLLPQIPDRMVQFEKSFGVLSPVERFRIQALAAEARNDWETAGRHWQTTVTEIGLDADSGQEGKLSQGVILRHLAALTTKHALYDADEFLEDPTIHFLKAACAIDPDYLPSRLELIARYRKASLPEGSSSMGLSSMESSSKDWHRLVDETVRRFPEDASILHEALDSALARKAYKQAEGFARRLLTINSINPGVRRQMIELQLSYARKQVRAKRTDLALKALTEASAWERPDAPSASLRIVRGLVERLAGAAEQGEARLREGVELAGGGVAGWFRARVEAELMKDRDISWLQEELVRARETPPTPDAVLAVVSAVGQPEAGENRKAIVSLVLGMLSWLRQAAAIDWKPAEFEAVAEMLARFELYDLLREYAEAARKRDPANPTWRFHAIMARSRGLPQRLTMQEEDELSTLADAAAERQDFHMMRRISRFIEGDVDPKRHARRPAQWGPAVEADDPDEDDILALFKAILTEMPRGAAANLRKRVGELGREQALKELVGHMRGSPLGPGMPEPVLRELCAAMVSKALQDGGPKSGGGRQRSLF